MYVVLPISLLLLQRKGLYEVIFIGFFFMLIMSDIMLFAKDAKNTYIVMLSLFFFLDRNNFSFSNRMFLSFLPFFFIATICLIFTEDFFTSLQKTLSYILLLVTVPNFVEKLYKENGPTFFKNIMWL